MAYSDHFKLTDDLIAHLDTVVGSITDPFISARYTGFLAVSAVTVFELAIKDVFRDFAATKHKVLEHFTLEYFAKINGRIKIGVLHEDYTKRFGVKYKDRFKRNLDLCESQNLRSSGKSVKASYGNLIVWRHEFAHEGKLPTYATYSDVKSAYELGKEVVHCLAKTMRR